MRDRFVWSLISAVGIFFLGAGASVIHGIHSLGAEHSVEGVGWTYTGERGSRVGGAGRAVREDDKMFKLGEQSGMFAGSSHRGPTTLLDLVPGWQDGQRLQP